MFTRSYQWFHLTLKHFGRSLIFIRNEQRDERLLPCDSDTDFLLGESSKRNVDNSTDNHQKLV